MFVTKIDPTGKFIWVKMFEFDSGAGPDDMAPGPAVAFWPAPAPGMRAGAWPFGGTPASLAS